MEFFMHIMFKQIYNITSKQTNGKSTTVHDYLTLKIIPQYPKSKTTNT